MSTENFSASRETWQAVGLPVHGYPRWFALGNWSPQRSSARQSYQKHGFKEQGKGLAFTPRQVGNESILATNDIHCVPKCSSQYRHLNQYQVQVRGYEHISCNVLANAMVKHNSPIDNTSQPLVMTLEWVRHDTTPVVTAGSTVCS